STSKCVWSGAPAFEPGLPDLQKVCAAPPPLVAGSVDSCSTAFAFAQWEAMRCADGKINDYGRYSFIMRYVHVFSVHMCRWCQKWGWADNGQPIALIMWFTSSALRGGPVPILSSGFPLKLVDSIAVILSGAYQSARTRLASAASPVLRLLVQRDQAI